MPVKPPCMSVWIRHGKLGAAAGKLAYSSLADLRRGLGLAWSSSHSIHAHWNCLAHVPCPAIEHSRDITVVSLSPSPKLPLVIAEVYHRGAKESEFLFSKFWFVSQQGSLLWWRLYDHAPQKRGATTHPCAPEHAELRGQSFGQAAHPPHPCAPWQQAPRPPHAASLGANPPESFTSEDKLVFHSFMTRVSMRERDFSG
jgi:hypothetical protein